MLNALESTSTRPYLIRALYEWCTDNGLTPYIVFEGKSDHGDAEIEGAQQWLATHFSVANPVEQVVQRCKLAERTFKRRFVAATGLTPIDYVQRLRIEDAKRRLERTEAPIDEIACTAGTIGYELMCALAQRVPVHIDG